MPRPNSNKAGRTASLDSLAENELAKRLEALKERKATRHDTLLDNATHELQVYQIELEMQNRALRDAQVQLEGSLQRYANLFEFAPVGYCIINLDGTFREVNRTAKEMLGHGRHLDDTTVFGACVVPQDRMVVARHLRACLRGRPEQPVEVRAIGRGGQTLHLYLASVPDLNARGELKSFKVALIDISQRKATEARLQLMSQASEALASSLNYAISIPATLIRLKESFAQTCFVDLNLDKRDALRMHPATLGSAEEAAYAASAECLFPAGQKNTPQAQVAASGQPMQTAGLTPKADGVAPESHANNRAMLVVPLTAHGKKYGTMTCIANAGQAYNPADLTAAMDLGHRVAMAVHSGGLHEQVQEAVHARQMILATVSHDAKNVLTSVKMRGELLLDSNDPFANEQGIAIERLVDRMDKMLDDLMDIASIERGKLSMRPWTHRADALIAEAVETHRQMAQARNIRLEAHVRQTRVYCDSERILQVLSNLLSNAIKFSSNGETVTLELIEEDGFARISVKDRGPGIAPELLGRVFDQYWQAPESNTAGRGLGLAISQGIVRAGDGRIWVESKVGIGTTFHFTVPIAREGKMTPEIPLDPCTILVAEDDDDLRLAACEILRTAGYHVQSACNGHEALRLSAMEPPPSLVLLDLEMPVFSGWDFLRKRREKSDLRPLKVVVMSALSAARDRVEEHDASFLSKPLRAQELLDRVKNELQQ